MENHQLVFEEVTESLRASAMQVAKAVLITSVIAFWLSLCLVPVCLGIRSVMIFDNIDGPFAAIPVTLRWTIAISAFVVAASAIRLAAWDTHESAAKLNGRPPRL